jgi:hypothetical protein
VSLHSDQVYVHSTRDLLLIYLFLLITVTEAGPSAFANIHENYYYVFVVCSAFFLVIAYFFFPYVLNK